MLKGKKILVTGLTGNFGGSLAYALARDNDVWGFARFGRPGQQKYWEGVGVHTVVGDCAASAYPGLPDDFDYVIHSAADTQPASFEAGMRGNAEAPARLMAHCRKARAFMHISTAAMYAMHPDPRHEYTEEDPSVRPLKFITKAPSLPAKARSGVWRHIWDCQRWYAGSGFNMAAFAPAAFWELS